MNSLQRLRLAQITCSILPPLLAQRVRSWIYPAAQAQQDGVAFARRSITGSLLLSNTGDVHGYRFGVHGYYDWRNLAVAAAICRRGDTIVEVGANVGTETVGFSDIVGDSGRVIAFEPFPQNVEALRRSAAHWRYQNASLYAVAVADREGQMVFSVPVATSGSGEGYLVADPKMESQSTINVSCTTLDAALAEERAIKLIAIDAEGAEVRILAGAGRVLLSERPAIIVEANPAALARQGASISELHSSLSQMDYTALAIGRLGLEPVILDEARTSNWLCLAAPQAYAVPRINRMLLAIAILPPVLALNPLARYR